ncbi:serine/threonine-protein kinase [Frigoriglobus tundricola]|uniref:Serine/threonine protein kinase PrkC, regulator of stationary phase n=1 Tax=Frigoriglobus tundricola TaxID=2774151 RepID=A0A6M5Z272_9BACT|nr:serine/threonine-protein kinase [Frigoriglobus tundricola]QJW99272.1 Serine/threonine protein kinase PrkC, regulator of stationary phase [Frigoriglobus tundricola]
MSHFGIGELTVLSELGSGAGSRVFHVRRWADGAEYALKVVSCDRRADRRYTEQLRNEYRIGSMLDHPNLTKVLAFELRRDWLFRPRTARLLTELVPGQALSRLPALPLGQALRVFERTAAALAHMHSRGVFHADLKPDNLVYDRAAGVKVIDYGLARVAGERSARVQGTPQYMAPETAATRIVTARTDIYNLGATMYHVVTRSALAPMVLGIPLTPRAHAARIKPVATLAPDAPQGLCDLIHRCLDHNPDHRPDSAGAVRGALARLARATG